MKEPPRYVYISPELIEPGDEYEGFTYNNTGMYICQIIVDENNVPLKWGRDPIEEKVEKFFRYMTYIEENEWYAEQTDWSNKAQQLNLIGLHTDLYGVGDAEHEMWNAWIDIEWHKQIVSLEDEDFFIVGIAEAPFGCYAIKDPVAIVCEYYDNGDRFWCHADKDCIEDMREMSKHVYKSIIKED